MKEPFMKEPLEFMKEALELHIMNTNPLLKAC